MKILCTKCDVAHDAPEFDAVASVGFCGWMHGLCTGCMYGLCMVYSMRVKNG